MASNYEKLYSYIYESIFESILFWESQQAAFERFL